MGLTGKRRQQLQGAHGFGVSHLVAVPLNEVLPRPFVICLPGALQQLL